jgi:hypothetical protein
MQSEKLSAPMTSTAAEIEITLINPQHENVFGSIYCSLQSGSNVTDKKRHARKHFVPITLSRAFPESSSTPIHRLSSFPFSGAAP